MRLVQRSPHISIKLPNVFTETLSSCVLVKTKILLGGDDAEGVGVAHSASPALHTDDGVTLAENTKLDGVHDTPLQTAVNVLLPWLGLEVWLLFGEVEGVNAAVQVGVLRMLAKKHLYTSL
jgi:hypothetical protein